MGTLSKTVFEALADKLHRRIVAAVVTPMPNMLTANTEVGLAEYLDTNCADPDVQDALLTSAIGVDRQVLFGNLREYQSAVLGVGKWKSFMSAVNSLAQSAGGGSYASLTAYLTAVSAKVTPTVGEMYGASHFLEGTTPTGIMHPQMTVRSFDRVYTGTMGSLVDDTTDAGSAAAADVPICAADDDVIVLGSRSKFDTILCDLSTVASADCAIDAYYWDGAAWAELTLTDQTTGFSVNGGVITYTLPTDWVPYNKDMDSPNATLDTAYEEDLYYVIIQRTEATVAPDTPTATWFKHVPQPVLDSASKLYGAVDQPPMALVRITGTNTIVVTSIRDPEHTKFEVPGTANSVLKLLAITDIGSDVTFTLGYTDQAGTAATKAQTAWTAAISAGDTKTLALDVGDTGIRSIATATCAATTAATTGVFMIIADGYARAIAAK